MTVTIRVYKNAILVQCGQGQIHTCYDWIMVFDFIRSDDFVLVQNYTEN